MDVAEGRRFGGRLNEDVEQLNVNNRRRLGNCVAGYTPRCSNVQTGCASMVCARVSSFLLTKFSKLCLPSLDSNIRLILNLEKL